MPHLKDVRQNFTLIHHSNSYPMSIRNIAGSQGGSIDLSKTDIVGRQMNEYID